MSGAEAIAVLGVISSVIAIVDGLKKVYDTVKDEKGLPKAFSVVADQLLTVRGILKSAKSHIKEDRGEEACNGLKKIIDDCEKKAETLDKLFRKIVPKNGALGIERYWKAVKAYGKGNEVENLMKGIMEDVQLLACEKGMKTATEDQERLILKAIQKLSDVEPSVPDESQETAFTANNFGYGTQNVTQGKYTAQDTARQYNAPGGTMNFGNQTNSNEACMAALHRAYLKHNPNHVRKMLKDTKGSRVRGTCEWIKTNKLYESWLRSKSQLLWLSGGPGKGKTMLSIFLAEELEKNTVVLQYFCDNKDEKRNTAVPILRGLIFQLFKKQQELYRHILLSFDPKKSLLEDSSFHELWDIFEKMVCDPILGITYCILDGLDECDEASSEALLKEFKTLFSTNSSEPLAFRLHLIVVSRDLPEFIPRVLSNFPRIRLDPDAESEVNDDIRKFIEVKVNELAGSKIYPKELSQHVKEVFLERAQGTFLWVGLVAQALTKYTVTEVKKALEHFPMGLEQLYTRMLLQIDDRRRATAAKILSWVVLAVRPLTLLELSAATGITNRSSIGFCLEDVMKEQVSFCGDFLKIHERKEKVILHKYYKDHGRHERDGHEIYPFAMRLLDEDEERGSSEYEERESSKYEERESSEYEERESSEYGSTVYEFEERDELERQKVGLIHQSAKDYLLRETKDDSNQELEVFRVKKDIGNLEIVRQCLDSLQNGALAGDKVDQVSHLHSYAVLHWPEHARRISSEGILDLGHAFFQKKSLIREAWFREYWSTQDSRDPPHSFTLLHLASYLGIFPLAKNLLFKKGFINWINHFKINKKDGLGMTALHWAAIEGHEAVVQLLLENGAVGTTKDNQGFTVLQWAAVEGHKAVVQLLLKNGADSKAKNSDGITALHCAARGGREAVVQLLLENGADSKAKDNKGMTVLHRASIGGNKAVVQLLLKNGADSQAKNSDGMTALHFAARDGREALVQLLLENGADSKAKDNKGVTALHWAAIEGQEALVQLLLENGADVKAKDSNGMIALHSAVRVWDRGEKALVQLLLENGADSKAKDNEGVTVLHWAAIWGDKAMMQLLLENGADVKAKDNKGVTALHWAAVKEKRAVVQLLLENGADIKAKDSDGMTALFWARHSSDEELVRMLEPWTGNGFVGYR